MQISAQKDALRRHYMQVRRALDAQKKAEADALIASRVLKSAAYRMANTVLCYVSLPHEIDTHAILADAWSCGKCVAVPRCRENGQMDFFAVSSPDDLAPGMRGISEPKDDCLLCVPQSGDLCIVPCLAMDARGYRLGYGGGYYDRYLYRYPVRTVGLCYAVCLTQTLPTGHYDVPIQLLISEKEA